MLVTLGEKNTFTQKSTKIGPDHPRLLKVVGFGHKDLPQCRGAGEQQTFSIEPRPVGDETIVGDRVGPLPHGHTARFFGNLSALSEKPVGILKRQVWSTLGGLTYRRLWQVLERTQEKRVDKYAVYGACSIKHAKVAEGIAQDGAMTKVERSGVGGESCKDKDLF